MEEIRWIYRFKNFEDALIKLREAIEVKKPNDLEKEGTIQRFEYTYEMAWKTMRDYLKEEGIVLDPPAPRTVIKKAFEVGIIKDGNGWIKMMEQRNKSSHNYSGVVFKTALKDLSKVYYGLFDDLYLWLKSKTM